MTWNQYSGTYINIMYCKTYTKKGKGLSRWAEGGGMEGKGDEKKE